MPTTRRIAAKTSHAAGTRKAAAAKPAVSRGVATAAGADRAKHRRAAEMIRELRSGAEALLANADRLLERLS